MSLASHNITKFKKIQMFQSKVYLKGTKREILHVMHVKELMKTNLFEW